MARAAVSAADIRRSYERHYFNYLPLAVLLA
jgi:hypothetical protein